MQKKKFLNGTVSYRCEEILKSGDTKAMIEYARMYDKPLKIKYTGNHFISVNSDICFLG